MIEDRDYMKQELADLLYSKTIKPESRIKALWREVTGCRKLVQALQELHWNPNGHSYNRQQVAKIKEMLCRD